jgi:hypothetical protein
MSTIELNWLAERASKANVVVEIGSWKGRSTKALAMATPGVVYSVDHWLAEAPPSDASKAFYDWKEVSKRGSAALRAEFETNLAPEISAGKCIPTGLPSAKALPVVLEKLGGRKIDMIFIDADHDYEMVKQDIQLWAPHVAPDGLLSGHDYHTYWPGVLKAVKELVLNHTSLPETTIWYRI